MAGKNLTPRERLLASLDLKEPDHLAYFNQVVGGPRQGHHYLVDSNLDWGQDLKRLKAWMEEHKVGSVMLSYFGMTAPEFYQIEYECLPSFGVLEENLDSIHVGF